MDSKEIVWVKSGGRCAICNRYLLNEDYGVVVPVGENAHIVGKQEEKKRSPRSDYNLPESERDNPENLVLLCREQHKNIDNNGLVRLFSVEELRKIKEKHEARIYHVTGLRESHQTAILRMSGTVRGDCAPIDRGLVAMATIYSESRFPFYPFSPTKDGIEIDFQNLPNEGSQSYYEMARSIIDKQVAIFHEAFRQKQIQHVSGFAFARIPLLVYLGKVLEDIIPLDIYQWHRHQKNWSWNNTAPIVEFKSSVLRDPPGASEASLIMNISGSIQKDEIPSNQEKMPLFLIEPVNVTPFPDIMKNSFSLKNFEMTFRNFLASLEKSYKTVTRLHVNLAIPLSPAVLMGQCLNLDVAPSITFYEIVEGKRVPTMSIDKKNK